MIDAPSFQAELKNRSVANFRQLADLQAKAIGYLAQGQAQMAQEVIFEIGRVNGRLEALGSVHELLFGTVLHELPSWGKSWQNPNQPPNPRPPL
jgi:hypothetical protein